MSTSPAPELRICHFDRSFLPVQPYFCYKEEICCKDGCCSQHEFKYFQSWQFWYKIYIVLGIVILFVLYRYMRWYCRKNQRGNTASNDDVNSQMVNLMLRYNGRNVDRRPPPRPNITRINIDEVTPKEDPPPLYNVAVHLPKPTNQDEVPTYEQATSMN